MVLTARNKWQVWLPSLPLLPLHHLFPLFLPSFPPSVYGPTQCARLDETILVISACNGTLLTPITTIKTLLPLGPFQVLINQMAAKRPFAPLSHTHIHTLNMLVLTHLLPSLDRPHGPAKKAHLVEQNISALADKCLHFPNERQVSLSLSLPSRSLSLVPVMWV